MKSFLFIILLTISLNTNAQIGHKKHAGVITGTWVSEDTTASQLMLVLDSHGLAQFNGKPLKFVTHHNKLHLTESSITTIYTYELNGDQLLLSGGDLEKPVALKRQSAAIHTTTANTQDNSEHNIPKHLLGLWKGYNETIQFKPDAQCLYRDKIWPYMVNGNVITMQTPQGNFMMTYKIQNRDLHLTFGGQDHIYTKEVSVELVQTPQGKTLDLSIAGKWCFVLSTSGTGKSTECMTFNHDGTYEYSTETLQGADATKTAVYSDTGTWWVAEKQIFFLTEKQGQGSYAFEKLNHPTTGDAMIAFDGKTFASASNHAPW